MNAHLIFFLSVLVSTCIANDIILSACWVSRTFSSAATDQTFSFLLSVFDGDHELVNDNEFFVGRYHSFTLIETLLLRWDPSENPLLNFKVETEDVWETDRASGKVDMRKIGFTGDWFTLKKQNMVIGADVKLMLRCADCQKRNGWNSDTLPRSFLLGISQLRVKKKLDYVGGAELEVQCSSLNAPTHKVTLTKLGGVSGVSYRASETHGGVALFLWERSVPVYVCALIDQDYGDDEGIGVAFLSYEMVAPTNTSKALIGKSHTVNMSACDMTFISCISDSRYPEFTCQLARAGGGGSALEAMMSLALIVFLAFAYKYILS